MPPTCTGVILAGGLNTRFSGEDKAFFHIGGRTILDSIYDVYQAIFNEIIIVTNSPLDYISYDAIVVTDIYPTRSSLTGLHAGLYYSSNEYSFFVACDTPFVKKEMVETIINQIESSVDAIVPETSKGLEPFFSVYSKKCIKIIEHQLHQNHLKVRGFLEKVRTIFYPENKIKEIDPDLTSFFNINTPADLAVAKKMVHNI